VYIYIYTHIEMWGWTVLQHLYIGTIVYATSKVENKLWDLLNLKKHKGKLVYSVLP